MEILVVVISWLLFGGASSYFASRRGRDPFAWFLIGMLLGILGLLLLFLLPPLMQDEATKPELPLDEILDKQVEADTASFQFDCKAKDWYYLDLARNQVGPNSFTDFKQAFEEGKFSLDTFVWSDGMGEWKKVEEIPFLKEVLS